MSGYPDDTFGPELNMTRGEAAAIFARLSDYDDSHIYETSFSDISEGEWYENYIGFIKQFGMIEGYEDGTFRADNHITRAEFAAIIFRYTRLVDVQTTVFEDTESHWARSIISAIAEQGWLEGYEDGTFRPEQDITRAEAVTIINRALDRNADTEYIDDNSENLIIFKDMETSHWAYYDVAEATNAHRYMTEDGIENWIYDTIQ
ncbi:MAG: S-layer homology domain-containing protein [Oscillospiraceae bacterium]|nr:S-layer homology domain-containing protein [Oscillospiraceae bacterium]